MIAVLLLAGSLASSGGKVAIVSAPFELDERTARELCPADAPRLRVLVGDPGPVDVLARAGAATIATLDASLEHPGDDFALARMLGDRGCIVLEGGTWMAWWKALRPWGKRSALGEALERAHERGASLVGVGPAGLHLAEHCVLSRAALERPSRDPHDESLDLVLGGMGFARGLCFDFATDGRRTPERLLEAAFGARVERAVWLSGACAWIEDPRTRTATVAATGGAAWLVDASDARRSRERIEGVRLARLGAGARLDLASTTFSPAVPAPAERAVQNPPPADLAALFQREGPDFPAFFRKGLTLDGERHRLRFAPDRSARDRGGEFAIFDWLPLAR